MNNKITIEKEGRSITIEDKVLTMTTLYKKELCKRAKHVMENPLEYSWELQGFGMLRTYIDKDTRLQIWLKEFIVPNVTDIHTHPWDFESYIFQGEITNYCFSELPPITPEFNKGYEYDRCLILTGENAANRRREGHSTGRSVAERNPGGKDR